MPQFNENVELLNASGITVQLKNTTGEVNAGGSNTNGVVNIKASNGTTRITMNASTGDINAGGNGVIGDINLLGSTGVTRVNISGSNGDFIAGGDGVNGDLNLKGSTGTTRVTLSAGTGDMNAGGDSVTGQVTLKGTAGETRVRLIGDGNLWLGGNGGDGDIMLFKTDGDNTTVDKATIHLDGETGNIRCNDVNIPGADFAEDFDIDYAIAETLEPGTVMVLGRDGRLVESTEAFDRKVAGVVSGAGKYKAGIILDKQLNSEGRKPIALSGKVMCKVDATYGGIQVGDLITTSPRKGYAMKAGDPMKAFGAVIGKALADFPSGDGMLPILVALQ